MKRCVRFYLGEIGYEAVMNNKCRFCGKDVKNHSSFYCKEHSSLKFRVLAENWFCVECGTRESSRWHGECKNTLLCDGCNNKKKRYDNMNSGRICNFCGKTCSPKWFWNEDKLECNTCYRKRSNLRRDLICKKCGLSSSKKWYSGPLCRKCFRIDNYSKKKDIDKEWYIVERLKNDLRVRLNRALKGSKKTGSAVRDLGCTIEELKKHLESKWQEGMTWDNHSIDGWHIDHIRPLASFDLTDPVQLKQACSYTNLQPLWAEDNCSKGADYLEDQE